MPSLLSSDTLTSPSEIIFPITDRTIDTHSAPQDVIVQGDSNSRHFIIICDRYYDGIDLSEKQCSIKYTNPNRPGGTTLIEDTSINVLDNSLSITWYPDVSVTLYDGDLFFALQFTCEDESYIWQTKPATLAISEGLIIENYAPEIDISILREYIENARMYNIDDMTDEHEPIYIENRTIKCDKINVAINGDSNSQLITFIMPRYFEGVDLSEKIITIKYINANNQGDRNCGINMVTDENTITFGWLLSNIATCQPGEVRFSIEVLSYDETNGLYDWQTLPSSIVIEEGLNVDRATPEYPPSWVQDMIFNAKQILTNIITGEFDSAINRFKNLFVQKEENKGLSSNDYTDEDKSKLNSINDNVEKLKPLSHTHNNKDVLDTLTSNVITQSHIHDNKTILDKVTSELITQSHEHENKLVLNGITSENIAFWNKAVTQVDSELLGNSENPVQNKVVHKAFNGMQHSTTYVIGTSTNGHTLNDCNYLCDGINDEVEINEAIQALPSGRGTIQFLDGTYNTSNTISLNKQFCNLVGSGSSTIISYSGTSVGLLISNSDISIKFLKIVKAATKTATAIQILNAENISICNTTISNFYCGISAKAIAKSNIYFNSFLDNGHGIDITDTNINNEYVSSSGFDISNNKFFNNSNYGINLQRNASDFIISNNIIKDSPGAGIVLFPNPGTTIVNFSISNNIIQNNTQQGIYFNTPLSGTPSGLVFNGIINNNVINECSLGIGVSATTSFDFKNCEISNNIVSNNSGYGIYISGSNKINNCILSENICSNNNYGIDLYGVSNSKISGNICYRGSGLTTDYTSSQYTIYLSKCNRCLVCDNMILGKNYYNYLGTNITFDNNIYESDS